MLAAQNRSYYDDGVEKDYAQSENIGAAWRIIDRLRQGGWLERNKALGEAHPGLYDVVFTLEK